MIRTFVAVKIPANDALKRVLSDLHELGGAIRAVKPESMHITLKFLGETDENRVSQIAEIVWSVSSEWDAFETLLHGLGAFPHLSRPTVIRAGMQFAEPLVELSARLDSDFIPLGFQPEQRVFQPHLTLARIKFKPPRELETYLNQHANTDYGTTAIQSVDFYQSELLPDGPKYSLLASAPLRS